MRSLFAIGLSLFLAGPALGGEPEADDMIARGHYARGAAAYDSERYEDALHEFEAAHAAKPMSALDYNIARCLDHLGRRAEALAVFDRYMTVEPSAYNAAEVHERVAVLRHELAEAPRGAQLVEPVVTVAVRTRWIAPGAVGGGAILLGAIGAGLLGSAASNYHDLQTRCSPKCAPNSWSSIPAREHTGDAFLGVAAVVAVVDLVLIVRAKRRK